MFSPFILTALHLRDRRDHIQMGHSKFMIRCFYFRRMHRHRIFHIGDYTAMIMRVSEAILVGCMMIIDFHWIDERGQLHCRRITR